VATRQGATVALNANAVQLAARRAGLDWANAEGLRTIVVHGGQEGESPHDLRLHLVGDAQHGVGRVITLEFIS
jgi:hypothetical protein